MIIKKKIEENVKNKIKAPMYASKQYTQIVHYDPKPKDNLCSVFITWSFV